MPRPPQPCLESGCPAVAARKGRCADCYAAKRRAIDHRRPSSRDRGNTPKWEAFSKAYLAENPWCACREPDCHGHVQCLNDASQPDHIDGTGRTGPRAYDRTNLQPLCQSCHSTKTVRHDGGFGQ